MVSSVDKVTYVDHTFCLLLLQFQLDDQLDDVEFPHLRDLDLSLRKMNWHSVLLMLKNSPNLQSFQLYFRETSGTKPLPDPHSVPECLTSQFTKCFLTYFKGTKGEMQFAKFLMQNSTSLKSMTIRFASSCNAPEILEVQNELALCPRRSSSCELSFI